jgi:hypothetical protein
MVGQAAFESVSSPIRFLAEWAKLYRISYSLMPALYEDDGNPLLTTAVTAEPATLATALVAAVLAAVDSFTNNDLIFLPIDGVNAPAT